MNENTQSIEKEKFKRWAGLIVSVIFYVGFMMLREELVSAWLRAAFSALGAMVLAMGILQFQQKKLRQTRIRKRGNFSSFTL